MPQPEPTALSGHFDGKRFFNPGAPPMHGFGAALRWMLSRRQPAWQVQPPTMGPKPLEAAAAGELRATVIGHSTVLLQFDGINLLTDPIWSERASPLRWMGPRRFTAPAVSFADLPPIHAVLISHNHYDHLDMPTLRALAKAHAPAAVVPLKTAPWPRRRLPKRARTGLGRSNNARKRPAHQRGGSTAFLWPVAL